MDGTYRIGVVIEQGKGTLDEATLDGEFFLKFPHQGALIGRRIKGLPETIAIVDMTANTHGPLLEKTLLAGSASAAVMEDLVAGRHHHVGNELLQRGILFRFGAGHKEMVPRFEKNGKVSRDLGIQAVKRTELVKKGAADDENLFGHGKQDVGSENLRPRMLPDTFHIHFQASRFPD